MTCSIPICPLDRHWSKRTYIEGEPTCKLHKKTLEKLGYFPQARALTDMEKAQSKNWASHKDKSLKNLVKFKKGHTKLGGRKKKTIEVPSTNVEISWGRQVL